MISGFMCRKMSLFQFIRYHCVHKNVDLDYTITRRYSAAQKGRQRIWEEINTFILND